MIEKLRAAVNKHLKVSLHFFAAPYEWKDTKYCLLIDRKYQFHRNCVRSAQFLITGITLVTFLIALLCGNEFPKTSEQINSSVIIFIYIVILTYTMMHITSNQEKSVLYLLNNVLSIFEGLGSHSKCK